MPCLTANGATRLTSGVSKGDGGEVATAELVLQALRMIATVARRDPLLLSLVYEYEHFDLILVKGASATAARASASPVHFAALRCRPGGATFQARARGADGRRQLTGHGVQVAAGAAGAAPRGA
jgi:hypothetical protein